MINHFLLLQYLLYINPHIGLNFDFITNNCFAFSSGTSIRFLNRVCNDIAPNDAEINSIKSFFDGKPFTWFVNSNDITSISILKKNDLRYKISFPAMILNLDLLTPTSYANGITAKRIQLNSEEIEDWLSIVSQSFNVVAHDLSKALNLFIRRIPQFLKLYLGFYHKRPVAAAMFIEHEQTICLHLISTLSEFRNKGLGFAITHKMLFDAKTSGCHQAILIASQAGQHLYEKLGFREYVLYDVYGNY